MNNKQQKSHEKHSMKSKVPFILVLVLAGLFVAACESVSPQTTGQNEEPAIVPIIEEQEEIPVVKESQDINETETPLIIEPPAPQEPLSTPAKKTSVSKGTQTVTNYLDLVKSPAKIVFDIDARGGVVSATTNILSYHGFDNGMETVAHNTAQESIDQFVGFNLVLLGDSCNNAHVAEFLTTTDGCAFDFEEDEVSVRYLNEGGRTVLIILGYDEAVVHRAVDKMARGEIKYQGPSLDLRDI